MASTYSTLKVELIGTGEQTGTWGTTTNDNLSIALGEAITGSADVAFSSSDVTITLTDSNGAQTARNLRLNLTGTSGGARNLVLGSGCQIEKLYLINNELADAVTVKNTSGTGIAVPAGSSMFVYNNGTNVVEALKAIPVAAGGTGLATLTANNVLLGNGTNAVQFVSPSTNGNVLTANGTTWVSSTPSGATITGTTTSATFFVVGTTSTSGSLTTASISNTNAVSYNASTGALTAVSVVSSSDERLKENWRDLPNTFLDDLAEVKHGSYNRIGKEWREVGVSAQSLMEILPEAVPANDEGMLSVAYGNAALIAAIELAKEIKVLRAEIVELRTKLNNI